MVVAEHKPNEYLNIFVFSHMSRMNVRIYSGSLNMLNEYSNIFLKFPLKENYDHIQNLRNIEKRKKKKVREKKNNINSGHHILPEMTRSTVHTSFGLKNARTSNTQER